MPRRPAPHRSADAGLTIPHRQLRLENGLNVILHQDSRLPRVVVNLLYRVGSRNDPRGRTGMAHLLEHLMFMGTRRLPENRLDLLMEELGGSNNAFTSEDVTDYYDLGPAHSLELLLWIEADRMASMAQSLTQKKLDLQREVVLNERRQSYENAPYGVVHLALPSLTYGEGHPYSWPIIGSSEDLRAVTVADVKSLFRGFYSPRNASLVVAGDFDGAAAERMIRRLFSSIPDGARRPPARRAALRLRRGARRVFADQVELPRLYLVWHSPASFAPGDAEMDLAASILSMGKQSRLHRELVYEKELALDVEAHQESRQLGSIFSVEVTGREGMTLERLERATMAVLTRFLSKPVGSRELARAVNGYETEFVSRLERISRRAELLNLYYSTVGQPDYAEQDVARYRAVTPASLHRWARRVLGAGRVSVGANPAGQGEPR